jgi:hypothetical protein
MKKQPYHIVRTSKIHGKGVFARNPIRKGTKVIEYTGDIVTDEEADIIGVQTSDGHTHTMLFTINNGKVINGNTGGDAKYINHSCEPNCETVQYGDKIFIEALRSIPKGEELTYDYHLEVDGKITKKVIKEYACFCGSPNCRGTQIAPDLLKKYKKKVDEEKAREEKKALKKSEKESAKKALKEAKKAAKLLKKAEKLKKAKAKKPKKNKTPDHIESGLMVKKNKKPKKKKAKA